MDKTIADFQTGEIKTIPLTPEEVAEIQARASQPPPPEPTLGERLNNMGLDDAELSLLFGDDKLAKIKTYRKPPKTS